MKLKINDSLLEVIVNYKPKNKNMYMRLDKGVLYISSFKRLNETEISKIVSDNIEKISYLLNKEKDYKKDNVIHFFGKAYELKIEEAVIPDVSIYKDKFIVKTNNFDPLYIKILIQNFYVNQANIYICDIFDKILIKYSDILKKRPRLKFKHLKTAFGKCYPKKNEITFSGICMKLEPKYIEYVIYHELAHFKFLGHQSDFYEYLESKLPGAITLGKQIRRLKYRDIY